MAFQSFHLLIPYKLGEHKHSICRTQPGTEKAPKNSEWHEKQGPLFLHLEISWKGYCVPTPLQEDFLWSSMAWQGCWEGCEVRLHFRGFPPPFCLASSGQRYRCSALSPSGAISPFVHFAPGTAQSQRLCWSRPLPSNNLLTSHSEGKFSQKNWVQLSKSRYTRYCI